MLLHVRPHLLHAHDVLLVAGGQGLQVQGAGAAQRRPPLGAARLCPGRNLLQLRLGAVQFQISFSTPHVSNDAIGFSSICVMQCVLNSEACRAPPLGVVQAQDAES